MKQEQISCIYLIICLDAEKLYVGQTNDFYRRVRRHKGSLKRSDHYNRFLQRIYNKYGDAGILYIPILECAESKLNDEEKRVFNLLKEIIPSFIINSRVDPTTNRGLKRSIETIRKHAEKITGKPSWNKGIKGEKSHAFGVKRPHLKISWNAGTHGVVKPNKTSFKKGQVAHNKGVPMSEESKAKVSNSKLGTIPWNKGLRQEMARTIAQT